MYRRFCLPTPTSTTSTPCHPSSTKAGSLGEEIPYRLSATKRRLPSPKNSAIFLTSKKKRTSLKSSGHKPTHPHHEDSSRVLKQHSSMSPTGFLPLASHLSTTLASSSTSPIVSP